ncbi:acyl carrier protein [Streptomyces syringium]|uniref:Acyl carrier protein n=1 Tax=Streptomyces syringium TaxID=76729 RepID=A0ABS4XX76_9ACTN|nr:phosphopantetheine-binding protein [Streptomyces syringium]MBP2400857.1 acyl carrier protein [Streptomyces syringium]
MGPPVQPPFDFVRNYLATTYDLNPEELTGSRSFDSLELDSIAQVEMFVTVSDHYRIQLNDSLASGDTTLQETADLVQQALDAAGGRRPDESASGRLRTARPCDGEL